MVPSKCRPGRGPRAVPGPVGAAVRGRCVTTISIPPLPQPSVCGVRTGGVPRLRAALGRALSLLGRVVPGRGGGFSEGAALPQCCEASVAGRAGAGGGGGCGCGCVRALAGRGLATGGAP